LLNAFFDAKFQHYKGERRPLSPNQRGLTNSFAMSERGQRAALQGDPVKIACA